MPIAKVVIAGTTDATYDEPGQLDISGSIGVFSTSELTIERAQEFKTAFDRIPEHKRTDVTITTYGDTTEESIEAQKILKSYYKPITKLTHARQATVVYTEGAMFTHTEKEDFSKIADSVRFVEVSIPGKDEYIPYTTLLYVIFEMPFREFIQTHGSKIGLSEGEQKALFGANPNIYSGTTKIKPVKKEEQNKIARIVAQNA